LKFYVNETLEAETETLVSRPRWDRDFGVKVSRRDRDVRKNASRPSREGDVRDRDYNPALYNIVASRGWQSISWYQLIDIIPTFVRRKPLFPYQTRIQAKILGYSRGVDQWCWGLHCRERIPQA